MSRGMDAALATGLLAVVTVLGWWSEAEPTAPFVLGGVALTLVLEALAGWRADVVRRAWSRPVVNVGSFVGAVTGVALGIRLAPSVATSIAVGAVVTYLALLVLVTLGVIPPPDRWLRR